MLQKTTVAIHKDYSIGKVEDRVFSSFVEHMGSCVYNGLYQPGHPEAEAGGFRRDVLRLVRALRLPALRYPGGNYTSGYNWEDSVGENRPTRLDLAWKQTEPNTFGLHEFAKWQREAQAGDMIMTVNLGTRGADDARNLLEYCNHPGGSLYSDLRRRHGLEKPLGIRTWCLGNELDATWQICHKTPEEYGRLAAETARLMRRYDKALELVAVGSSHNHMPTFPEWDRKVLMECYEDVDFIALHKYVSHEGADTPTYLAAALEMEEQIKTIAAAADYVKSVKRSRKTMKLAFDEWNVTAWDSDSPPPEEEWQIGPDRAKKTYTMEDALAFASMMLTLIRNADRVQMACQAILINVLPMIFTDKNGGCCATTLYYPFLHGSLYGRGTALQCLTQTPLYDCGPYEGVPTLDAAAVHDPESGAVTLFAVNRSSQRQEVEVRPEGFEAFQTLQHIAMNAPLHRVNTPASPLACVPREQAMPLGDSLSIPVEGYSWNVIRVLP